MKEIKLKSKKGTHTVTIYDSIEQLPARRYNAYNKWTLLSAGIGSSLEDFDRHHQRLDMFIQAVRTEQAIQEFHQLRNTFHLAINEINPRQLSFACLVLKINNEECFDLSQEGLQRVIDLLSDCEFSNGELENTLSEVKKKLKLN